MDHATEAAQHGGVTFVELGGIRREHGLLVKVVLAKIDLAAAGVVHKLVVG